ncbi:hypothetical protein LCGC14_1286030 [marine sediment metagenome]|uniref:Uncharacterized protein n=1 Tax=marine sediment metagenome TaxID=412755 RepID=A0A0F9LES1_9ZZZZ
MIDLKKDIKVFLKEQKFLIPRLNAMDKTLRQLEKKIERHIRREWKATKQKAELHLLVLQGGSHTTSFKMDILINLRQYALSGRKWAKINYDNDFNKTYTLVDPPIDIKFLKAFAERMTKELGILVYENQEHIPTKKQLKKQVEKYGYGDFAQFNITFNDDLKLIESGKVWYKGWEIPDEFLICQRKSNNKLVITYSTNGHAGGFDIILDNPMKEELDTFLEYVEQDNDNSHIRTKLNSAA